MGSSVAVAVDANGIGREVAFLGDGSGRLVLLLEEALHELGIELAGAEFGIGEDALVEWNGGVDALDDELREGSLHAVHRFFAV